MLLWAHCSSFGGSRCDSQHGRMCLSKMRCYYLYAGFRTAWVLQTMGWNLGTDQYESDPASYWCLKAGNLLKTTREGYRKLRRRYVCVLCWDHQMICWSFHVGLVDMDPADQPCPARSTPSIPTVLTWLQVCRKNLVDLSETPRLGWWQLWKVQQVRGLVRSEVVSVEELSMGEAAEGRWWQLDMTDGSQRIILWFLSFAPWETRWFHWILCP